MPGFSVTNFRRDVVVVIAVILTGGCLWWIGYEAVHHYRIANALARACGTAQQTPWSVFPFIVGAIGILLGAGILQKDDVKGSLDNIVGSLPAVGEFISIWKPFSRRKDDKPTSAVVTQSSPSQITAVPVKPPAALAADDIPTEGD